MPNKNKFGRLGSAVRTERSIDSLIELRNVIADTLDQSTDARSVAQLSRQMTEVLKQIDEIRPPVDDSRPVTPIEQLMERRKAAGK